jgi:hypothetical protein
MYYPYLRGKQFELLALREFANSHAIENVSAIIEPVRDPEKNTGFGRALRELKNSAMAFTVVVNPQVGDLSADASACNKILRLLEELSFENSDLSLAIILSSSSMLTAAKQISENANWTDSNVSFIYPKNPPIVEKFQELADLVNPGLHIADSHKAVERYESHLSQNLGTVVLEDPFPAETTNAKYVGKLGSVFPSSYSSYKKDGFVGFSDFLTIGDSYSEGGSAPKAVVIHLTYKDPEQDYIVIEHFTSDSNDDSFDTAGKFREANTKLVDFVTDMDLSNPAIKEFKDLLAREHFPGLGFVKKLSILNHLWVMNGLLSGDE